MDNNMNEIREQELKEVNGGRVDETITRYPAFMTLRDHEIEIKAKVDLQKVEIWCDENCLKTFYWMPKGTVWHAMIEIDEKKIYTAKLTCMLSGKPYEYKFELSY